MKKSLKILISTLLVSAIVSTVSLGAFAHHITNTNFNHHAHVSQGNPFKAKSVTGDTTWASTYHYTRAQLQDKNGKVMSDSGRKYGTTNTSATTSYYGVIPTIARTYYGR